MNNPTEEGIYTTIFKDGTIIHYNYWMILEDGKGKWYWNSTISGGVIHWFKPEENYIMHKNYKLPDCELRALIERAKHAEAYEMYGNDVNKILQAFLMKQGFSTYEDMANYEMNAGYYRAYEVKE